MKFYENFSLNNIFYEYNGVLHEEKWKDIIDYENLYQISNLGRVKAKEKKWVAINNPTIHKEKILKQQELKGYLRIFLWKNGKPKLFQTHRLVGIHFLKNTENKPHINHKNGDRKDNKYFMLEWVTASENILHSFRVLGKPVSDTWKINFKHDNAKKILCVNNNEVFNSITEAAEKLGIQRKYISRVCNGKRNHTNNLQFKFI